MKSVLALALLSATLLSTTSAHASCSCNQGGREECGSYDCAWITNDQGATVASYVRNGYPGAITSCYTMLNTYWRWQAVCKGGSAPAMAPEQE